MPSGGGPSEPTMADGSSAGTTGSTGSSSSVDPQKRAGERSPADGLRCLLMSAPRSRQLLGEVPGQDPRFLGEAERLAQLGRVEIGDRAALGQDEVGDLALAGDD